MSTIALTRSQLSIITVLAIVCGMTISALGCDDDEDNEKEVEDSGRVEPGADSSTDAGTDTGPIEPAYEPAVLDDGQMELPLPTGPYRVGVSERLMTPGGGAPNEIDTPIGPFTAYFTRIFFPVDPAYTGETFMIRNGFFTGGMLYIKCGTSDQVLTHTYLNAQMVSGKNRFPVLLFAPGGGSPTELYLSILEDLASHGYIVVAFQPEGTFAHYLLEPPEDLPEPPDLPDPSATEEEWNAFAEAAVAYIETSNRVMFDQSSPIVASMVADAVHTLDQIEQLDQQDPAGIFTNRLDLEKVGIFGHSVGGATAREACVTEPRFKACGNLDGTFFGEHFDSPLARPLMIQLHEVQSNPKITTPYGDIDIDLPADPTLQTVWDVQDASAYRITIRDIAHLSFMDINPIDQHFVWSDEPAGEDACVSTIMENIAEQGMTKEDYIETSVGTLDPVRAIDISRAYTRAFFDKHLKGIDQDLLEGPSEAYPEVTFDTKHPQ